MNQFANNLEPGWWLTKTKYSHFPEYGIWAGMRQRCLNPKVPVYHRYGGRGIKVCDRWLNSFKNFLTDMGQRPSSEHSIDRIDNEGNYEPGNCKWSTKVEQNNNTRSIKRAKGYSYDKKAKIWRPRIRIGGGETKYLGSFKSEAEARKAYLDALELKKAGIIQ